MKGEYRTSARVQYRGNSVKLFFEDYHHQDARTDYQVVFHDKVAGDIYILCELLVRRNPDFPRIPEPWMADCRLQHHVKTVPPERNARARVHIETIFRMLDGTTFYATIKDMNAENMCIVTFQPMNKSQHIFFSNQFGIQGELEAEAVRARQLDNGSYEYECRFTGASLHYASAIQDFVTEKLNDRSIRKS